MQWPYRLELFTLRMWQEQLDAEQSEWRGEIKNTRTGEVRYFRSAASLYDALQHLLSADSETITGDGVADDDL